MLFWFFYFSFYLIEACVSKTSHHIQIKIKIPNLSQEPPASSEAPNQDLKDMELLRTLKIWNMDVSKTGDHIQVKIKIPNLSQEPLASSKAQNKEFEDMDVLCTFKIKIESQKS